MYSFFFFLQLAMATHVWVHNTVALKAQWYKLLGVKESRDFIEG